MGDEARTGVYGKPVVEVEEDPSIAEGIKKAEALEKELGKCGKVPSRTDPAVLRLVRQRRPTIASVLTGYGDKYPRRIGATAASSKLQDPTSPRGSNESYSSSEDSDVAPVPFAAIVPGRKGSRTMAKKKKNKGDDED